MQSTKKLRRRSSSLNTALKGRHMSYTIFQSLGNSEKLKGCYKTTYKRRSERQDVLGVSGNKLSNKRA
jgi:Txe/YoeB family toxin of Txe-Axe toxin-antitoxin module